MSVPQVDLPGLLRRIRRRADVSQRELAAVIGTSKSAIAAAEAGQAGMDVRLLAVASQLASLRLALLDEAGTEVRGMHPDAVRDRGGRRFPAHLDTMLSERRGSRWEHRPRLQQPTYTFDRRRPEDDVASRATDRPDDHLLPQPGDAPWERAAARAAAARQRRSEERERRRATGEHVPTPEWTCACPAACDELDDRSGRPVHAGNCPCSCDLA